MNKKIKIAISLLGIILILATSAFLLQDMSDQTLIKQIVIKSGFWGYLVILTGITVGGILIPLSHLPFTIVSLTIYDFWPTVALFYIGNLVLAPAIDFWLARRYGRPLVLKLAGEKSIRHVDRLVEIAGLKSLIVLRIFGGLFYDSISYAIGLTKMRFKDYYLVTLFCPVPLSLLTLFVLNQGVDTNPLYFGIIVVWGYIAGALTFYWLYRKNKKIVVL